MTSDKPSFHDPDAQAECYVDGQNEIHVVVPSDIWMTADQAERFAAGLLACARWARRMSQDDRR